MPHAVFLQHVPFEGPAKLGSLLEARGYTIDVVPVFERPDVPDLRAADLVVATGGPMSVNDEDELPWLAPEKRALREAIEARVPTLGICLGSQLIASALGAAVRSNDEREVGWFGVHAVRAEPLAEAVASPERVLHWHGERWDVPVGARLLASSEGCDHQAFAIDDHVLGLQYHLEMDRGAAAALVENCPDDLAPGPWVQPAEDILDAVEDFAAAHTALERTIDCWMEAWEDG